jgi:hypothetical protein
MCFLRIKLSPCSPYFPFAASMFVPRRMNVLICWAYMSLENLPKNGKHVTIDVILMLFKIKGRL